MKKLLFSLLLLFSCISYAHEDPISVDQAFQFSAAARDSQTILLHWKIAPGYYLYRDRFHFKAIKAKKTTLGQPLLPSGIEKTTQSVGTYTVYKNKVTLALPVIHTQDANLALQVTYQGCSQAGYCYPPTSKVVTVNLTSHYGVFYPGYSVDIPPTSVAQTVTTQPQLLTWLLGFFGIGILISLTPCCLPMIPILSGILAGQKKLTHGHSFLLSLSYVLGMAITYAIAGVLFGFIGASLQALLQQPWIIALFSAIFVAMAFSLFGYYDIQLPASIRHRFAVASEHQKKGSYMGAALMGICSTLILSPCVTAPLVGILGYISHTGNATLGGIALFIMGVGMGIPLLIIGLFGAKVLPKPGHWMNAVRQLLGILMLGVAIWMLQRILPDEVTMLLWAALAIGASLYLGALSSAKNTIMRIKKTLGIVLFIYGILLIVGALSGRSDPLRPIVFLATTETASSSKLSFISVKSIAEVNNALERAKRLGTPVMLDFYADWCISCKEMENITFSNEGVKQALQSFMLLRADVTKNNSNDRALEAHFRVVAPPTILFFNANGDEATKARIVGAIGPKNFLKQLDNIDTGFKRNDKQ